MRNSDNEREKSLLDSIVDSTVSEKKILLKSCKILENSVLDFKLLIEIEFANEKSIKYEINCEKVLVLEEVKFSTLHQEIWSLSKIEFNIS